MGYGNSAGQGVQNVTYRAEDTAQRLRAHIALAENLSSVPITYAGRFTFQVQGNPMPQFPTGTCIHMHIFIHRHICIHIIKKNPNL